MLKQSIFAVCLAAALAALAAEPQVNIIPLGPAFLPAPNLVRNSDFAKGTQFWDIYPKGTTAITIDKEKSPVAGGASIKITGQDKVNNGARIRVYFKPALKAGEPVYIRIASKNEEPDLDRKSRGSIAVDADYADKTHSYQRTPLVPSEDHDWTYVEGIFTAPKDIDNFSFYLCYYNHWVPSWLCTIFYLKNTLSGTSRYPLICPRLKRES